MTNIFTIGLYGLLNGEILWTDSNIKALIVDNTYSFDNTDEYVSDVSGSEVTNSIGTGYERKNMLNRTVVQNANVVSLRADDLTFTSVSTNEVWDALILFVQGTNDADSKLIAYLDIDNVTTNGSTVDVAFTDLIRFANS